MAKKYKTPELAFGDVPFIDIDGYEGRYAVSADGRVYSYLTHIILRPEEVHNGYLRVNLTDEDGSTKHRRIHVLVAEAFIPNPENKSQVHHLNHDRKDNRVENLQWATQRENLQERRQWKKH